jgi:hypothetical protein
MAKNTNPTGVYAPLNRRARKLVRQLRAATHRAVQNAIIQELLHEMQKGSRRVRKQSAFWGAQVKKHARQAGGKAGAALRKRAAEVVRTARYGPKMHCACGESFRSRLLFNAHARAHQREQRPLPGRPGTTYRAQSPKGRQAKPATRKKAQAHARNVMHAAGPQKSAAVRKATAQVAATGQPLRAKDLKDLAKQARTAPPRQRRAPYRATVERPMDPTAMKQARATRQTPATRAASRKDAILRRELRATMIRPPRAAPARTPKAAPALKLAPVTPPRVSRPAPTIPARPGRS